ncbi:hypothetical protein BGZ95_007589, partial [Linnemannia exigua]
KNLSDTPIPKTLPLSLVPPSLRKHFAQVPDLFSSNADNGAPFRKAESEQISKLEREGQTSSAKHLRGSFKESDIQFDDLWTPATPPTPSKKGDIQFDDIQFDDLWTPATSPTQSWKEPTGIQDLIGLDTDLWSKSTTSKQDQLDALESKCQKESKAVKDLQTERAHLESETRRVQEIRVGMEQRLSYLTSQQERESKTVQDLKTSLTILESELSALRMAIMVSKRELQVAQADKTAFLEAMTNGQEESLELKVTLQRNYDEVKKLRADLVAGMKILGLDPLDFPGTTELGHGGSGGGAPTETRQDVRSARRPQFVMENLLPLSPKRNPQFREPEPPRRVQGPQDRSAWQDEGLSKP